MEAKTEQLQIRVTRREKAELRRKAAAAGQDVSAYVLARVLPRPRLRFEQLLSALAQAEDHRFVLAELNDQLTALAPIEFSEAVAHGDLTGLTIFLKNCVAAMVEQASHLKGVPPPTWAAAVEPLAEPHFAVPLKGLRLHLLQASPVAFKRRNIFVDSGVGDRV